MTPTGVSETLPGKPRRGNTELWTRQCFLPDRNEFIRRGGPWWDTPLRFTPLCAVCTQWPVPLLVAVERMFLRGTENTQQRGTPNEGSKVHSLILHLQLWRPPLPCLRTTFLSSPSSLCWGPKQRLFSSHQDVESLCLVLVTYTSFSFLNFAVRVLFSELSDAQITIASWERVVAAGDGLTPRRTGKPRTLF